jgi:hypothetical protein
MDRKETVVNVIKTMVYELYSLCHDENGELNEGQWDECLNELQDMVDFMNIDNLIYEMEQ